MDNQEYKCNECGWRGGVSEVIQAGLNNELCPICEGTATPAKE